MKSSMWKSAVALAVLGSMGPVAVASDGAPLAPVVSKLHADLDEVLRTAAPDQLVPIKAIMRDRVPQAEIEAAGNLPIRDDRRVAVRNLLKSHAQRTQVDLLAMLERERAAGRAGERIRPLWMVNVIGAEVVPEVAYAIAARDDVELVAHNPMIEIFDDPPADGPPAATGGIECGVDLMGAPRVWSELGYTGSGSVVAVIDSGTCYDHSDLENQMWTNEDEIPDNGIDDDDNGYIDDIIGWSFRLDTNDPNDWHGHGTHTSGTVAGDGTGGTQTGMAPGAKIMALSVSGNFADEVMVWDAMQYAADNGAHAWNMSLGWPHSQNPVRRTWREICINAIAAGTVPVIAAGNEGSCCPPTDHTRTPGDVPEVVTVGATDCNDAIAGFSSRGPVTWETIDPWRDWPYPPGKVKPTVSAPGVNTNSTRMCAGYTNMSGTSMATPHVAGGIALMFEANPNLTTQQVKDILSETSVDLGEDGWDNVYGAGRMDVYEAVQAVSGIKFQYPDGLPEKFSPTTETTIRVVAVGNNVEPAPGTGKVYYAAEGEEFTVDAMNEVEENVYDAVLPAFACFENGRFYFSVEDTDGVEYFDPGQGDQGPYTRPTFSEIVTPFEDDFEQDQGWSVVNENLDDGAWERGAPFGAGDSAPDADFDGSGQCYVTGNRLFQDVDGGPTRLVSPPIDMTDADGTVAYARYFVGGSNDRLTVEVSNDGGSSWVQVEDIEPDPNGWASAQFTLSDFVPPTDAVMLRFSTEDNPNNSFTEAAVDAIGIEAIVCRAGGCERDPAWQCDGDTDGDGQVNPVDAGLVQSAFGSGDDQDLCNYDLDCDGQINPVDSGIVQALFGTCEPVREVCP